MVFTSFRLFAVEIGCFCGFREIIPMPLAIGGGGIVPAVLMGMVDSLLRGGDVDVVR